MARPMRLPLGVSSCVSYVRAVPDEIFADPRLARFYDTFEGPRTDLPHYLTIARELLATTVVDIGCGTGAFASAR